MRFAKKADGSRLFSSDDFLTTQQIQSFFSRLASKLRHAVEVNDSDIRATQEEQEYHETRQAVLDEVQLQHPIAYDNLNLFELNKKRQHENTHLSHAKEYLRLFWGVYRRIPPKAQSRVPFRVKRSCKGV